MANHPPMTGYIKDGKRVDWPDGSVASQFEKWLRTGTGRSVFNTCLKGAGASDPADEAYYIKNNLALAYQAGVVAVMERRITNTSGLTVANILELDKLLK